MCDQAKLAVKYEYIFGFLELVEEHTECELEEGLLTKIECFLREIGSIFTFIVVNIACKSTDINFLFIFTLLSVITVAIELKSDEFQSEYVRKMQFYLRALDKDVKLKSENFSIEIILFRSKNKTIVKYTLHYTTKPLSAFPNISFLTNYWKNYKNNYHHENLLLPCSMEFDSKGLHI
ncbi:PDDEXK nuclease domain-containing protein [Coxiella-like endosymbiont]|uniref:PDDEXK nuclease domain-containing protein n=1 Tax=Coxiella-like endosymbiont TaxID=1592897 RepID=UPI0034E2A6C5